MENSNAKEQIEAYKGKGKIHERGSEGVMEEPPTKRKLPKDQEEVEFEYKITKEVPIPRCMDIDVIHGDLGE